MNEHPYSIEQNGTSGYQLQRNRVMRNTYWLLALSMLPTIAGAWIGLHFGIMHLSASPGMNLILFFAIAFGLIFAIQRTKNSGWGVVLLLAFTFFMGLMLSGLLGFVLGFENGTTLIMLAFAGTSVIFTVMASIATVSKANFSGLGKWLFAGLLVLILASIANLFLKIPALMLTVSVIAIVLFSAYLLYDVQRVINGGETNYINATLAIYLDLYNIFTNLLSLLSIFFGGSRR